MFWLKKSKELKYLTPRETTVLLLSGEKNVCSSLILDMEEGKQEEKQPVCNILVMAIGWKTRKFNHIVIPSAW